MKEKKKKGKKVAGYLGCPQKMIQLKEILKVNFFLEMSFWNHSILKRWKDLGTFLKSHFFPNYVKIPDGIVFCSIVPQSQQ